MSTYSVLNAHRLNQNQLPPQPSQSSAQSSQPSSSKHSLQQNAAPSPASASSKIGDLLEGVKREYEKLAADAIVWKNQRDEMEAKLMSQVTETQLMRQSLWDLEAAHVKIRQEYEHELLHLRRLLDSRNSAPTPASSAMTSNFSRNPQPPGLKSSKPAQPTPSPHPLSSQHQHQSSYGHPSAGPPVLPPAGPAPGGAGDSSERGLDKDRDRKERFLGAPPGSGPGPAGALVGPGLSSLKGKEGTGAESPTQSTSSAQPPLSSSHPGPNSASSVNSQPLPSALRDRAPDSRAGTPSDPHHPQQQQPNQPPSTQRSSLPPASRPSGPASFSGNPPPPPGPRISSNSTAASTSRPPPNNPNAPPPQPPAVDQRGIVSDIDPEVTAKELRKEGGDWAVTWSAKVKKSVDVSLKHTFVHDSVVCCVKFSYDGKWVATGCNKTVQIFDTATGMKNCILQDETSNRGDLYIRTLCFSPSGSQLATGAEDRQIRIWDVAKRRIRHILQGHTQEIYSLEFASDGKLLASGSGDKSVRIWDTETGACRFDLRVDDFVHQELGPVDAGLTSVAFSPDSRLVAGGCLDSQVRIWDTKTGVQLARLSGHTDSVYSIAFSPDGNFLCSGSLDRTIRVWDLSGPQPQTLPNGPKPDPMPNGAAGTSWGALWSVLGGHKDYVLSVAVSTDNRWVVSGSKDRSIQFFDVATGQVQLMLNGHKNSVISIDLAKNGNLLASGSGDMHARVWSYTPI